MKKLASTLLAAGFIASSALMADAAISAVKVKSSLDKVNDSSSVWKSAKFVEVSLYPQTTIQFNDKKANEINANNTAVKAKVAAVYNGSDIAFMVKWADGTKNIQRGYNTDSYGDGFAIQFASNYANAQELPYIGMGSEGRPVVIHLQKETGKIYEPNGEGDVFHQVNPNQTAFFDKELKDYNSKVETKGNTDYERSFVAEGFRSMTEIKDGSSSSYARMAHSGKEWTGTVSRSIKDDYINLDAVAIPVSFAVWDGEKMGRNGLKYLSSWTAVTLKGSGSNALVTELTTAPKGDAAKGKIAVANNGCVGCHQIESTDAANLMGPALTNIGGYSTTAYLRESLVNPTAVVVPGYNRNAHSNTPWYNVENGKRVSAMPDFSWAEAADIEDMVAYLKTLKAEVK